MSRISSSRVGSGFFTLSVDLLTAEETAVRCCDNDPCLGFIAGVGRDDERAGTGQREGIQIGSSPGRKSSP
jgi:hypothetical protein